MVIDFLGSLLETEKRKMYILISMNQLRKYSQVYVLSNQGAVTVTDALGSEFSGRFSALAELHSDQGRRLESLSSQEISNLPACGTSTARWYG